MSALAVVTSVDTDDATARRRRRLFDERLRIDGLKIDANIEGRVTRATLIRTMAGASSVELECADHDLKLLRSGLLTRSRSKPPRKLQEAAWQRFGSVRLTMDGGFFRLAGVNGVYNATTRQVTLIFEDEVASLMRRHKRPVKTRRNDPNDDFNTRADFIWRLAKAVQEIPIPVYSPESNDRPRIKGSSDREKAKDREKGIAHAKRLTIKGVRADRDQIRNLERGLAVCDTQRAGERATLAWIVAVIQESLVRNVSGGDSSSVGILQLLDLHLGGSTSTNGGRRDIELVTRMFLVDGFRKQGTTDGAIKVAANNPDFTPGQIAAEVQGNRNGASDYTPWEDEAEAILDAWGGAGTVKLVDRPYEFRSKKGENYWNAAGRLADEVRWRLFADQNVLWYVSDEYLLQSRPTFVLDPTEAQAVRGFQFDADVGIPVSEFTIDAGVARWVGAPGSVVDVEDLGPLTGRWLLWENRLDLFTEDATLTLRRPQPKLPEPAPTREKVIQTESEPEAGSVRAEIVRMARKALRERNRYVYEMSRPYPSTLFPADRRAPRTGAPLPTSEKVHVDCSSFVTLVYKAAGADDPNNRGFDGNGYTGTLWANGTKTNDPQPGDLCFYGSPMSPGGSAHVNVYIGNGESINMGPSAGVSQGNTKTGFRSDFVGYRSYA